MLPQSALVLVACSDVVVAVFVVLRCLLESVVHFTEVRSHIAGVCHPGSDGVDELTGHACACIGREYFRSHQCNRGEIRSELLQLTQTHPVVNEPAFAIKHLSHARTGFTSLVHGIHHKVIAMDQQLTQLILNAVMVSQSHDVVSLVTGHDLIVLQAQQRMTGAAANDRRKSECGRSIGATWLSQFCVVKELQF